MHQGKAQKVLSSNMQRASVIELLDHVFIKPFDRGRFVLPQRLLTSFKNLHRTRTHYNSVLEKSDITILIAILTILI